MNTRGPPPPPPVGAMPVFHDGQHPPQQQGFQQQQPPMQQRFGPPPFISTTRVSDIRPPLTLSEEYCRRQLTTYEVYSLRKAEPIRSFDSQDIKKNQDAKKQKKGSQRSSGPKLDWQRVAITQESYEQEIVRRKIQKLARKKPITDKKADLPPHMSFQVNKLLDEKNNFEYDSAFTWTLTQLDRQKGTNKETNRKQTETLTLYLKRAPRPDVNVIVVYNNIEKSKMPQSRPPPQQAPNGQQGPNGQQPPQQRAPSQGPPGQAKGPGKFGPPPVQIIHDGPKNGGKVGGKGGQNDVIHIIETGGPQRKPGKTTYINNNNNNRGRSVRYHSDSRSSRSSRSTSSSRSDSESDSAYSDSETVPSSTSMSSHNGRRRDSGYGRGRGNGQKHHEKGFFMVDRPRRHSASYVPDPPRNRAPSYERKSTNPIEVEHRISEAKAEGFAAGFTTASRVTAVDRTTMPSQRTIMYPDDHSQRSSLRSFDDEARALDESRAEIVRLENKRLHEDLRLQEERRIREDLCLQEEANARLREEVRRNEVRRFSDFPPRGEVRRFSAIPVREDARRFSELPTRGELRLRTDLRRAQDTILLDELPSQQMRGPEYLRRQSVSPLSFESIPSPRGRDFGHLHRGSLSPQPLYRDVSSNYGPNPFAPRRQEYRD